MTKKRKINIMKGDSSIQLYQLSISVIISAMIIFYKKVICVNIFQQICTFGNGSDSYLKPAALVVCSTMKLESWCCSSPMTAAAAAGECEHPGRGTLGKLTPSARHKGYDPLLRPAESETNHFFDLFTKLVALLCT